MRFYPPTAPANQPQLPSMERLLFLTLDIVEAGFGPRTKSDLAHVDCFTVAEGLRLVQLIEQTLNTDARLAGPQPRPNRIQFANPETR